MEEHARARGQGMPETDESQLGALPAPLLLHILAMLPGRDAAALACTNSSLAALLRTEASIWQHRCFVEFGLTPHEVALQARMGDPLLTELIFDPEKGPPQGAQAEGSDAASAPRQHEVGLLAGALPGDARPTEEGDTRAGERGAGNRDVARSTVVPASVGATCSQARAVFSFHHGRFRKYGDAYPRALALWRGLLGWSKEHFPGLAKTILPGAGRFDLEAAESKLGVKLPAAMHALYCVHDGQLTPFDAVIGASEDALGILNPVQAEAAAEGTGEGFGGEGEDREQRLFRTQFYGLLGSYAFYDHVVSTRLLPLQLIVTWTLRIRAHLTRRRMSKLRHRIGEGRGGTGTTRKGRSHEDDEEEEEDEEGQGSEEDDDEDEEFEETGSAERHAPGTPWDALEGDDPWDQRVLIAASFIRVFNGFHFTKMFFLDCTDGCVYVGGSDVLAGGALLLCTPPPPPATVTVAQSVPAGGQTRDSASDIIQSEPAPQGHADVELYSGLLSWLEEYVARLQTGMYRVREILEDCPYKGICLFPDALPLCTKAVTRGVCVRASALYVPEASPVGPPVPANPLLRQRRQRLGAMKEEEEEQDQEEQRQLGIPRCFAYSIRMRLLSEGEVRAEAAAAEPPGQPEAPLRSCQLQRRHWLIEEGGVQVAEVRGEAVVGKYPLLIAGEQEFVYQSCTQMSAEEGAIEGDFTFVPGSIVAPTGDEFEARVPRYPLKVPDYIY